MANRIQNVVIENARLAFKNFEGREGKFNRKGDRSFSILLEDNVANNLIDEGWNVKELKAREDGDRPQPYITVSIRYPDKGSRGTAPKVVLISSRGYVELDEDTCEFIDQVEIKHVDVEFRPYEWVVNGNTGVKAYLKEIFVTQNESYLARKYRDVPKFGSVEEPLALTAGDNAGHGDFIEGEAYFDDEDQKELES